MKLGRTNGAFRLTLMALAICVLAMGSPVQADPPGKEYDANVFGTPVFASDGTSISMTGSIHFKLRNNGKDVSGGGTYEIDGVPMGAWSVTKLEGFVVKGHCADYPGCTSLGVPATFTAGKGTFKIELDGMGSARFIMWCRLPGIPLPPFNAFPESYRVDIGSLHFDSQNPAGNFFERTD